MALSLSLARPAEALHYYAAGSVKSDSWGAVPLVKKNALYDAIIAKLPTDAPFKVLEIGCGTGGLALRLSQNKSLPQVSYVGIDLSPASISTAKAHGLDSVSYAFEVQNAYEFLAQTACDWDYLVSSMFLFGHDDEVLSPLRVAMLQHARKGVIVTAGVEYQTLLSGFTSDLTTVAGMTADMNMVVAHKPMTPPRTQFPSLNLPLRARIAETGALNYSLADLAFKNTGSWPATVQGVDTQKVTTKKAGTTIKPSLVTLTVPQKLKG